MWHSVKTNTNTHCSTNPTRPNLQNRKTPHYSWENNETTPLAEGKSDLLLSLTTLTREHNRTSVTKNTISPRRNQPLDTNWALKPDQCFNCFAKGHGAELTPTTKVAFTPMSGLGDAHEPGKANISPDPAPGNKLSFFHKIRRGSTTQCRYMFTILYRQVASLMIILSHHCYHQC